MEINFRAAWASAIKNNFRERFAENKGLKDGIVNLTRNLKYISLHL